MNWNKLNSEEGLAELIEASNEQPIMIFKHSTRCSISSMALGRLERSWNDSDNEAIAPYYLDLIAFRSVSDKIEELLNVRHESPQVIVLRDGKAIYDASHMNISYGDILSSVN